MPLPKYLLEQPKTNPLDSIARRIAAHGVSANLTRRGTTIVVRNLEQKHSDHLATRKAIRTICEHADAAKLTCEAFVPAVLAEVTSDFKAQGFHVVLETDEDDEAGAHIVLRRPARRNP